MLRLLPLSVVTTSRAFTHPSFIIPGRSFTTLRSLPSMPPKRKRAENGDSSADIQAKRPASRRIASAALDPQSNKEIYDAPADVRASPDDSDMDDSVLPTVHRIKDEQEDHSSPLSDVPEPKPEKKKRQPAKAKAPIDPKTTESKRDFAVAAMATQAAAAGKGKKKNDEENRSDPDEDDFDDDADPEEITQALSRPPPINSDYLPLPWKGRLGYACLNTYLRNSNPPIFQSRTTRIAQILEHRHPLKDPAQPHHPIKNRPDKDKPADVRLGQQHIEALALANCKDMIKMIRWNDRYNIKFFRLSSEAFPFASHKEYGYKLAPFATEALAEVGKVIAELGHRVTTHPGQFTQLGSPRQPVIDAAFADLEIHDEFLSLLKLPPQQDRDAVMVLHMGGAFPDHGGKPATLDRFRENYAKLSQSVKNRLVLENDDMSWSVHDILPICQELGIPLVLDFHHHNIIFDSTQIHEGSKEIMVLYPAIKAVWDAKQITQKMHYSEPTPKAITGSQRRKHNPRVWSLPPCAPDMDLMIEAKDKEQAVFELMRTFKLPGFNTFNDIIPHVREDDNKPIRPVRAKKAAPKKKKKAVKEEDEDEEMADSQALLEAEPAQRVVPDEELGMGGPDGRVYWPPGMEEWLRPVKRVVKKKVPGETSTPAKKGKATVKKEEDAGTDGDASVKDEEGSVAGTDSAPSSAKKPGAASTSAAAKKAKRAAADLPIDGANGDAAASAPAPRAKAPRAKAQPAGKKTKVKKEASVSEEEAELSVSEMSDSEIEERMEQAGKELAGATGKKTAGGRSSARAKKAGKVSYKEEVHDEED